jgi:hypothetical protein
MKRARCARPLAQCENERERELKSRACLLTGHDPRRNRSPEAPVTRRVIDCENLAESKHRRVIAGDVDRVYKQAAPPPARPAAAMDAEKYLSELEK